MSKSLIAAYVLASVASYLAFALQGVTSTHTARHSSQVQPRAFPYNVVLVVLDDLGTEELVAYGDRPDEGDLPQPRTPALDALRESGILFRDAHVDPLCSPTRAQVLTGRHAHRTGVGHAVTNASTDANFALSPDELLLPRLLGDAHADGYARAAFGKWHLAGRSAANDTDPVHPGRGFELFQGHLGNNEGDHVDHFHWRKVTVVESDPDASAQTIQGEWDASVTVDDALSWIGAQTRPFFAYVCLNPPHEPLQVPPFGVLSTATQARLRRLGYAPGNGPWSNVANPARHRREVYRAMVEGVDHEVGRLLDGLDPALRATTMVIVLGDNGTVGSLIPDRLNGMRVPSYQGKRGLYTYGTRVPLLVAGPLVPQPVPPGGWTCSSLVQSVDLYRTIARIGGISDSALDAALAAAGLSSDSLGFYELIRDPTAAGARLYAYSEEYSPNGTPNGGCGTHIGVRRVIHRVYASGHYKYMRKQYPAIPPLQPVAYEELYLLDDDVMEVANLLPVASGSAAEAALLDLSAAMDAQTFAGSELELCQ